MFNLQEKMNLKKLSEPTYIFSIILILVFISMIIYDYSIDESKNIHLVNEVNYKFETNEDFKKLELQINYLSQNQTFSTSWIDQKETNAWAAFALYLTGLAIVVKFYPKPPIRKIYKFFIPLVIITVAISAFAFIHAQYSSLYDTSSHANASNFLIKKIIDEGKPVTNFSDCLKQLYHRELSKNQKFRGKKHPLKILKYYILLDWIKSSNDRKINNLNIQEATIYFLLILFNIISIFIIIRSKVAD